MKKQLLFLTTAFIIVVITSCTKEMQDHPQVNNDEAAVSAADEQKGSGSLFNAGRKLELWFPFDGNIDEISGKPVTTAITTSGADVYTEDRFGTPNGAIKFDGTYGILLNNVRASTNMSVSAWVKYGSPDASFIFFYGPLSLSQSKDKFGGTISTPNSSGVSSSSVDGGWHHVVATYDGSYIKLYVDGNFVGEMNHVASIPGGTGGYTYWLSNAGPGFWKGCMDDLRFYTRTLKANEVQALYNM